MKKIKKNILNIFKSWDGFWFKPVDIVPLSCFRFCFCSVLLVMYLIRFFDIRIFFYESGLMSGSSAKALRRMYSDKAFDFILSSDVLLYLCYLSFIIILLLMALGVAGRLLYVIAFVLHLIFMQRNPSIVFGADMTATFWLFYLMFTNSNRQIKWVHYLLNRRKGLISDRQEKGDWLNTMGFRFIQIQMCVIYMFSGLEKLRGGSWWEGTAIWEALSFYDFTLMDFSFLLSFPLISAVLVAFTVLFEIYFPVLIWLPRLRKFLLLSGLFLHLGIAFCLNLYFFSFIILSSYVLFIPPESLKKFLNRFFG